MRREADTTSAGMLSALAAAAGGGGRFGLALNAAPGSKPLSASLSVALPGGARAGTPTAGVGAAAGAARPARASDFTPVGCAKIGRLLRVLRQESSLEPPQLGYVYTQPARQTVEATRVVRQVEEREVVEVVKREVTTLMRSSSPLAAFTRADFAAITDQVYSALARRLLVERERLGLSA